MIPAGVAVTIKVNVTCLQFLTLHRGERKLKNRLTSESTSTHRVERAIDLGLYIARQLWANDSVYSLNACGACKSLLERIIGEDVGDGRDKVLGCKVSTDAVLEDSELGCGAEIFA